MRNAVLCALRILISIVATTLVVAAEPSIKEVFIDYSYAGYEGGGQSLPIVPERIAVEPSGSDDTALIQAAIDQLASLPLDAKGFRGAVVLRPGKYQINGQLRIRASGIVLRGDNATLIATGHSRRTLIDVRGDESHTPGNPIPIKDEIVPAGVTKLRVEKLDGLTVGARIVVSRPSTKEWISTLGMDQFTGNFKAMRLDWLPGSRDLAWERTITAIDATSGSITLDAPITTTIEKKTGAGTVQTLTWPGRLHHVGIEGIRCESSYGTSRSNDEEHAWLCLALDDVENAWVRDLHTKHFVSAAVWLGKQTCAITVQDCTSESPVGENGGWRRLAFYAGGQQILVQRCTASGAREAFSAGLCSAGPNVFLDCSAQSARANSGAFESWASGALFDNVKIDGAGLFLGNLASHYQGAGWNAANSVLWNCTATSLTADSPPSAKNLSITDPTTPSLYRAQLTARAGKKALAALNAAKLPKSNPKLAAFKFAAAAPAENQHANFALANGRFTYGNKILFGTGSSNAWWKGQAISARAVDLGWHPARWAPGLEGPGLTEDLPALAKQLAARDYVLVQIWPGLWYDRRRDDHKTDMRPDSEVWAPFYEQPWARSGEGTASDGLSKYDLTKFNSWYWDRFQEFARACEVNGQILYHHFYNHHNLVEAAAHWADCPWRPANCLQETGFPEPPPFEKNGSRIGIVSQFYDVSNPVRRELHRLFIWHGLDVFADNPNVIHTTAFQFAGPLSFQQFFIDTVAEWEKARGKKARIVLNTSKNITDAILDDPLRAPHVEAIDMRYWQYLADGTLFAPHSDGQTAFREDRTQAFGKDIIPVGTPELAYKQVREYHDRFPDKAIICNHAGHGPIPLVMAGAAIPLLADYSASQPLKNERDDAAFFDFIRNHVPLESMQPDDDISSNAWCLSNRRTHYLLYSLSGDTIALKKPQFSAEARWFNTRTGEMRTEKIPATTTTIAKPNSEAWLLLLQFPADKP